MSMSTVEVVIHGVSPLLQSRFTDASEIDGDKATRKVLVVKKDRREAALAGAYVDADGSYYHPGASILRLLREAGGNHKMKGSRKSTKYLVPSAVLVTEDCVIIRDPAALAPLKQFEVDSRSVVNPTTKGRIMSHRPRWDAWAMLFHVEIATDVLEEEFIHQLLTEGGRQIGIGAFRPEKGGPFDRFRVVRWLVVPELAAAAE